MTQISVVLFHPAQVLLISTLTDESLIFELIYNIHLLNLSENFHVFMLIFYSLISFNMADQTSLHHRILYYPLSQLGMCNPATLSTDEIRVTFFNYFSQ